MKILMLSAGFAVLLAAGSGLAPPAQAKGCIKGAVVGGVAGHYAGHHAVLGALGGCAIGHHMATKHARERDMQQHQDRGSSGDRQSGSYSGQQRQTRTADRAAAAGPAPTTATDGSDRAELIGGRDRRTGQDGTKLAQVGYHRRLAMDPRKFQDPFRTAGGDRRAQVTLRGLETLWFNTGTLCNLSCGHCYIEFVAEERPAGLSDRGRSGGLPR